MRKRNEGFLMLEALLASGILAVATLMLMHSSAQSRCLSALNENRLEAHEILRSFQSHWVLGNTINPILGIFKNNTPFEILHEEDLTRYAPLEKSVMAVSWTDALGTQRITKNYATRIR